MPDDHLEIRPARPDDALGAHLVFLSGPEGFAYGFALPPAAAAALLAELWPHPGHLFSYQWAHIAEVDGQVQGLLLALPGAAMARATLALAPLMRHVGLRHLLRMAWQGSALARVTARVPRSAFYIANLAVLPEARGCGIAGHLLALAERLAAEAGCTRSALDVVVENERARRVYERAGYAVASVATSRRLQRHTGDSGLMRMVKAVTW